MPAQPPGQHFHSPQTALDGQLREAYRATLYRFAAPGGELLLQVDRCSKDLQQLLLDTGHRCAAVLTACNPGSQLQPDSCNQSAQAALQQELQSLGLACIAGRHEDPAGRWPDEAGVLVPGLACDAARDIAVRYGQLAFLWCDLTATPRLVETTSSGATRPTP